jgi:hypothetical protein
MILEARSPSCWSNHYVLKMNGRPLGEFRGRWFSEAIDVRLMERRTLHLEKSSWLGSHFTLTDAQTGQMLGQADRAGLFTAAWNLQLLSGPARLASPQWFTREYTVTRERSAVATVRPIGFCEGGWLVEDSGELAASDLILIGLIYHTILERAKRSD